MKMKLSRPVLLGAVGAVVLLTGILAWFFSTYTWVNSVRYRKDVENLDLSGAPFEHVESLEGFRNLKSLDLRGTGLTVEQYEQIKASKPDCQIRWDIPFQGTFLADDTAELTVTELTDADVAALSHLTGLKTVDASNCDDYAQLSRLQRSLPEATVSYIVPLAWEEWPQDTKALTANNADSDELLEGLDWLPFLETVELQGNIPSAEDLTELIQTYPQVAFSWVYEIAGERLKNTDTSLELSGWKVTDLQALEDLLVYGPSLEKLVILESGLSHEKFLEFQEQHPDVALTWDVVIEGRPFRTDITEMDLSGVPLTSVEQVEKYFPCFPNLTRVDMSHTGLSNDALDALNKKYEDIRIVWLVQICEKGGIMSDATYFMPYQLGTIVTDKEMELLKYCPDLICVDVGHMRITKCDFVKYLPKLQYLIMADTRLENVEPLRGHESLIFLEIFLTRVTDYSPLLECPNLLDLNIANNFGDLTPLAEMTWLERLWICPLEAGSHKKMPEMTMLREALPNTQVEYSPYSTGMDWREHPRYFEMRDILGMFYLK